LPVGAGFSATSANETAGARSRWAAWSAAGTVIAIALTLLPMVALTPEPILAAIVIHAVGRTLRLETFRPYFQWQRDRFIALAAVIAVLLLGVLDGLLAAVAVSLVMILRELSEPKLSVLGRLGAGPHFVNLGAHPEAIPVPGLLILRPEAPLFFANSERIMAQVRTQISQAQGAPLRAVILSLEESPDLDGTAVESIGELASDLHSRQLKLMLARLKEPAIDVLRRAAVPELPPAQQMNWNVAGAVDAALAAG
jgi:MFS superfamily sulfate permease-like transporter